MRGAVAPVPWGLALRSADTSYTLSPQLSASPGTESLAPLSSFLPKDPQKRCEHNTHKMRFDALTNPTRISTYRVTTHKETAFELRPAPQGQGTRASPPQPLTATVWIAHQPSDVPSPQLSFAAQRPVTSPHILGRPTPCGLAASPASIYEA